MTATIDPRSIIELYPAHIAEMTARFSAALEATRFDSAIVYAGDEITVDRDDAAYAFVAEPYFKAWAPLTRHPGSALQFTPGKRPHLVLFEDQSFWHEPPSAPAGEWLEHFELSRAGTTQQRDDLLASGPGRTAAIGPRHTHWLDDVVPNDTSLLSRLDLDRARKTPYESTCIAHANEIAARGHAIAQGLYAEDASEFAISLAYCEATNHRETELPYGSIVAFNEHAAVLHYQNLRHDPPGTPSSFLLDAGAAFNGYAADITRTVSRGSAAMAALIDAVDALQRQICAELRPGVDFVAANERAHQLVAEALVRLGIVSCTADDALERGVTRTFLPHGLGHLLGLQVHDAGGRLVDASGTLRPPPPEHPMLRLTRLLEPGFVITVEPGIYFIPSLLAQLRGSSNRDVVDWRSVEALAPFGGVRIEDDVLVTSDGIVNLSRPALAGAGI